MGAGAVALSALPLLLSGAQAYPDQQIRIVVPYPPGGPADIITRLLSEKLTATWGKRVVVENRSGASGAIGSEVVARASPDGYTLLVNALPLIINPLYHKLAYDPFKDFTPITEFASFALILVVHPSVPVKTLGELIPPGKNGNRGCDVFRWWHRCAITALRHAVGTSGRGSFVARIVQGWSSGKFRCGGR